MAVGLILGGLGLLFLGVGVFSLLRARRFLKTAVAVEGKVVGFEEHESTDSDGHTSTSTHPVVEFATTAGKPIKFVEETQTFGGLSEGEGVPVKYDPSAPEHARIATGVRLWIGPIVFVLLGMGLLIPGVIALIVA